jgi:hypothetical protein
MIVVHNQYLNNGISITPFTESTKIDYTLNEFKNAYHFSTLFRNNHCLPCQWIMVIFQKQGTIGKRKTLVFPLDNNFPFVDLYFPSWNSYQPFGLMIFILTWWVWLNWWKQCLPPSISIPEVVWDESNSIIPCLGFRGNSVDRNICSNASQSMGFLVYQ